ncbi:MAG: hypothetical protein N2746_09085 [Deltaproteobacteria bacterium]|nr:hypothetical protein [Deltaproteobacteria bacterium]
MDENFIEKVYPFVNQIIDEPHIALLRKRFFSLVGDIYENEDFYEERINAFLEWLFVDAETPTIKRPLLGRIVGKLNGDIRRMAEAMIRSRRSLFILLKKEREFAVLEDIFDRDKFFVDPDPRIENTEKKSLLECRVGVLDGRSRIMSTYIKYPDKVKKILMRRLKKIVGEDIDRNRERFLTYSFALFVRSERYRNVSIEKIAQSLDYIITGK